MFLQFVHFFLFRERLFYIKPFLFDSSRKSKWWTIMVSTIEWGFIRTWELSIVMIRWKWEQVTFLDSVSVQFSRIQLFANPCTAALQPSQSITNSQSLHKLILMMPSSISSSVVPFSSHLQSFPASGSFPMGQFFTSGGQSIGVSASTSDLPMNTQDWSPSGWTGWISLQSKGLSRVFSNITVQKHQFFSAQPSLNSNSHTHTWLLEKPKLWLDEPFSAK